MLASYPGNASQTSSSLIVPLRSNNSSPSPSINPNGTDSILTVLVDYSGHDETSTSHGVANPRGLLGALPVPSLNSTSSSNGSASSNVTLPGWTWRIQGVAGGSAANIDPIRGPVNEGGLYGERLGWHLPGFDASSWASGSPLDGISQAGLQWYVTEFNLSIPSNYDAPISLVLTNATATPMRVQAYVNGYLIAKFWPHIGPQTRFTVQPGVLNTQGGNRVAVAVWAQDSHGARLGNVSLVADRGIWESGYDFGAGGWEYLRPVREPGREAFG